MLPFRIRSPSVQLVPLALLLVDARHEGLTLGFQRPVRLLLFLPHTRFPSLDLALQGVDLLLLEVQFELRSLLRLPSQGLMMRMAPPQNLPTLWVISV